MGKGVYQVATGLESNWLFGKLLYGILNRRGRWLDLVARAARAKRGRQNRVKTLSRSSLVVWTTWEHVYVRVTTYIAYGKVPGN